MTTATRTATQTATAPTDATLELRDSPQDQAALVPHVPAPKAPSARVNIPARPAAIFSPARQSFWARYGTAVLVLGCLTAGALLHDAVRRLDLFARKPAAAAVTPLRIAGPITLDGPGGPVTLPMATPVVINVWLQDCADCQTAVEAWQALQESNGLEALQLPVVNIAFGGAGLDWAASHKLDERLVYDPAGKALVRPLGIGSFTTIIMDELGYIRLKDRPDQAGFEHRLVGAARTLLSQPKK